MSDGYQLEVDIQRVEKLQTHRKEGRRWRLHTPQGVFLTAAHSEASAVLTGKETGPARITTDGTCVTAIELLIA